MSKRHFISETNLRAKGTLVVTNTVGERLQQLTNSIVAGDLDKTRYDANLALAAGCSRRDLLDTVLEAANIHIDLMEMEEYGRDRSRRVEEAFQVALKVLGDEPVDPKIRSSFKVAVGPVGLKDAGLLCSAVSVALRSIGFVVICLEKTNTPLELLRNSEELDADLVIPLLPKRDVATQLEQLLETVQKGGFKGRFEVIPLSVGMVEVIRSPLWIARNIEEAVTKSAEWALQRQRNRG